MSADGKQQQQEFARLWGGFRASRVILTANNLEVFEYLVEPVPASALARKLRTDLRATEILLDALTSLGLLRKSKAGYRNTPLANRHLVRASKAYQGDMLRHADTLWKSWSQLDEVVKTGKPRRTPERRHDVFIRAMHNNAVQRAGMVVSSLDLRGVKRALDLGGGPGTYSIALAKQGVQVTLFDLPNTLATARSIIKEAKARDITMIGGDFHFDAVGAGYDLVLLSQIVHSYGVVENKALIAKSYEALSPGGTIAIHEFRVEENRAAPAQGALFAVNMLVNTAAGRVYTPKEIRNWLGERGFRKIAVRSFGDTVLVTGKK